MKQCELNRHAHAAHTRGESMFVDDLPEPAGLLHGAPVVSPIPHGRIIALDTSAAEASSGLVNIFTAQDIPGENQIGGIVRDEPLLADGVVHFVGQPIALVVAESREQALRAAARIKIDFEPLPAIFDAREAAAAGQLIAGSRTLSLGDVATTWERCHLVLEGTVESGSQEHLYLETQAALAIPEEGGRVRLIASTQSPSQGQRIIARVLGLPMNAVSVEVRRLGGGFGGKEDQATVWAAMSALAATWLGRPVKIVLDRHQDMAITGKRHPYVSDYKIGLTPEGKILAFQVTLYQNSGAAADLSTAILERTLFHATNSYFIPNVEITALPCRTNLVPFTAFRGFGAPQAMFVIECAIARAALELGLEAAAVQRTNLLSDGDLMPCGMAVENSRARRCFAALETDCDLPALTAEIAEYNLRHRLRKRGLAVMPVCFGISFTSTFLNQAGALVHVYSDGSVSVSTGAVEMGQGVNQKIRSIAAATLGIAPRLITIESTSTRRVANTSPTAASSGADLNGAATLLACQAIRERLVQVAAEKEQGDAAAITISQGRVCSGGRPTELSWEKLIWLAYSKRVNLSSQAHYATPGIHYDRATEKGKPFAYHVFGAAVTEVTLDCRRGIYSVDRVRVVHDAGRSLAPLIDRGQIEGGVVQGVGWMTMEELLWSEGRLLTATMSTYKVPDIHAAPEIETVFLEDADNPEAVLSSKAVGEPPFMYGIGAYFALLDAMRAYRPDRPPIFAAPLTPEKVLMYLSG